MKRNTNRGFLRRALSVLLCLLLLSQGALAELSVEEQAEPDGPTPVTTEDGNWPELNADGYLDAGEFVYENPTDGVWRYCSATLKVEVYRRTSEKPRIIWYEAEVWSREEVWDLVQAEKGKYVSAVEIQPVIASRNGCVLAINADELNYRWSKKNNYVGIAIRDGKILWDKTRTAKYTLYPPLNNLVLYEDGNMEVYGTAEKTAQEFIDMGAWHVLSFGPYLVRDGVINTERCEIYNKSSGVARTAIGMVEKGHYFAVMAEGRHSGSRGVNVLWMAEKMAELGCTTAFNLDGGRTASIEFMGKQICTVGAAPVKKIYARRASELLYIGTSRLVEGYDPELASIDMKIQ